MTATGTHGSGDRNVILATSVAALEIVRADGSLVTVDRTDPALPALAVGLGLFGVVVRMVLDAEPTYLMRQDVYLGALGRGPVRRPRLLPELHDRRAAGVAHLDRCTAAPGTTTRACPPATP